MIGLISQRRRLNTNPAIDESLQSVLDYSDSQGYVRPTDQAEIDAMNTFVKGLKSSGIWERLDVFYLFRNTGDLNFRFINYKSPGLYNAVMGYGSMLLTGDGIEPSVNSYVTAINISTGTGLVITETDACVGSWVYKADTVNNIIFGRSTSAPPIYVRNTSTNDIRLNSIANTAANTNKALNGTGLILASKNGTEDYVYGSSGIQDYVYGASTLATGDLILFRQMGSHGLMGLSCAFIGGSLTKVQAGQLNNLLTSYT